MLVFAERCVSCTVYCVDDEEDSCLFAERCVSCTVYCVDDEEDSCSFAGSSKSGAPQIVADSGWICKT